MKKLIICTMLPIFLSLFGQVAMAIGYQHGSFPDELSPQGLPEAIPCSVLRAHQFTIEGNLACIWLMSARNITEWSAEQNRNLNYPNRYQAVCRKGTCRAQGTVVGHHPKDENVILSIWYYMGQSSDGKPVAYLKGFGPAFDGEAVSYAQAGQMLVEFYENSGIDNQKAIQFELSQHYDGGWEQFQADLNGGTASASTDPEQCLNAWIKAFREDVGEDAMIVGEQLNEWKGWCSKGKLP
ncbi:MULTISPECIES: hypothetical protein [Pseudomonadaceae]|jgi:hypothetical protein|uniref:Uncharacterized protein n=1 Tax=Stutzerimonas balearica TaxID=74829 RepID=A0A9X7V7U4_9GAMM|nr:MULTISPECIES: hypothetical protein [Pseudomonadaceae]ASD13579.1 hypothetical protein CD800_32805 [Pseudomonas aeruginosa]EKW7860754.1 hypothetical protein [Pseudomonas aeruginosa]MBA5160432.1 hypothetical protein [Pseudomonas aeruginosa]MBK3908437.1 hypothetical protein [Pseudomonas aeruginosa]MDB6432659.1 hypothetical protein [Pseudomonas aeruginosa]